MKRTSTFFFLAFLVLLVNFANGQIATTTRSTFTSTYTPITLGGGATASTALGDDAFQTAIPVGFTFNHAGVDYTTFQVCTNGWISFDATSPTAAQSRAPANLFTTTVPNRTVAGWYGDLNVTGRGVILYQTSGSPGSQVLTVQFENATPYFQTAGSDTMFINFQIKLYETSNIIEMIYGPKTGSTFSTSGLGAIGIEDATGGNGNYIDAVTGSRYTNNTMMNAGKWPTENYRFTPGGAPTAIAGGTYNVGIGQTYKNISSAFADLNHKGISGAITLNLTDNNYDTSAANGTNLFPLLLGPVTGSSAVNTITISKSVGNATITSPGSGAGAAGNQASTSAITTSTEPVIGIVGGDWITLKNVNLNSNSGTTLLDRGLYVINSSALDGSQNNTFRDFNVTLQRTNTSTVGVQQNTFTTPTNKTGTNFLNGYYNFNIKNSYAGIYLIGTGTSLIPDSANTVGIISGGTTSIGDAATSNDIGNGTVLTYGLRAAGQRDFNVSNITVQNVTTTGAVTCDGILLDSATGNSNCFNNVITGIKGTSTSSTSRISGITAQSGKAIGYTHTLNVYNNVVTNVTSGYTGAASATRGLKGMFIQHNGTGTTATINVSFNSVRLDGSGSLNLSNACYEIGTTTGPVINTRDNSFANFTGGQTGVAKHYSWVTGSTTLIGNTGSVSNYNDLYISNTTNGFVGLTNTTDRALLSDWQTAVSQDANSISADPTYATSTDLRPLGGSPLLGAGTTVAGITTDILGAVRNGSTPTIGAYEASVNVGPSISYTTLTNTSNTGNRTLSSVTITDVDGVAGGANAPRVYWKVNAGAYTSAATSSGSSPYDFTIGTTGLAPGDVVSYFVVAQDLTGAVSASPSTGFTATDVNNVITPPSTPNTYTIVGAPLSGDYTVGLALFRGITGKNIQMEPRTRKVLREVSIQNDNVSVKGTEISGKEMTAYPVLEKGKTVMQEVEETYYVTTVNGKEYDLPSYHQFTAAERTQFNLSADMVGAYSTITAAIADAALRGIGGATRFLLTDATYTESGSMTIPALVGISASNTLTIKPQTGVTTTVSVNSTSPVFISNSDYIIWDGSNALNGTSRDMTILNNGVTAGSSGGIFTGSSVAVNNNIVKNCIVKTSGSTIAYGIVFNSGSNNVAQNNWVYKTNLGIQAQGSLGQGSNVTITGNTVGDPVDRIGNKGIVVYATNGFTISQNTVSEINNALSANCDGILAGFVTTSAVNGTISRNKIDNIINTSGSGYTGHGIQVAAGSACNISVYDNVITRILGTGDNITSGLCIYNPTGILVTPTSTPTGTSGVSIYNNSIYLSGINGTYAPSSGWTGSSCIFIDTLSGSIDVKNNAMRNDASGTAPTYTPYAMVVRGTSSPFSSLNYNVYYENTGAPSQLFGRYNSVNYANYGTWAASGVGEGSSSAYADPGFTSTTDLSINAASPLAWNIHGMGTPIATVAVDYNGAARSTTVAGGATDIGAYNVTPGTLPPSCTASGAPAVSTTTTYTLNGRTIGSIAWGPGGAPPASMDVTFYPGTNPPGAGSYPVGNGYWVFTATGGTGYSYDITINYDEAQLGTITPETDLRLAKSDDGGALYTPYLTAGTGAGEYELNTAANTIKVYGLTSFSTFAITDNDNPLPVELSSFSAVIDRRNVDLKWSTVSEQNNAGFDIERKLTTADNWTKIGNVAGNGTSNIVHNYNFEDRNLATGKYNYRLKQIDNNGNFTYHQLTSLVDVGVPTKFDLSQNYPNPFNPSTKINFDLPFDSKVSIKLFDLTGREVATIVNSTEPAGYHTVQFNASNLSSGIYFYNIIAEGTAGNKFTASKKMVLVK